MPSRSRCIYYEDGRGTVDSVFLFDDQSFLAMLLPSPDASSRSQTAASFSRSLDLHGSMHYNTQFRSKNSLVRPMLMT
jgi:hypothetical protein